MDLSNRGAAPDAVPPGVDSLYLCALALQR